MTPSRSMTCSEVQKACPPLLLNERSASKFLERVSFAFSKVFLWKLQPFCLMTSFYALLSHPKNCAKGNTVLLFKFRPILKQSTLWSLKRKLHMRQVKQGLKSTGEIPLSLFFLLFFICPMF